MEPQWIEIRGARTHNLRNISLTIPKGKLVVFTGVSGSGKSSLALDTIFAEGQRRYVECLSPYLRRFLDQMQRPDVDHIVGLPPTLSVSQWTRPAGGTPRSNVATMTEIHDYLRVLYARCGDFQCPSCGKQIGVQSLEQILDATEALPDGERIYILAPLVHGQKGKHADQFRRILREGFLRARLDGIITMVDGPREDLDPNVPHDLEMVVDRQVVRVGMRDRLRESIQIALKHGGNSVIITYLNEEGDWVDRYFSTQHACVDCGLSFRPLQPRSFSFNSPYGACPTCQGLGKILDLDPRQVIADPSASLSQGAIVLFRTKNGKLASKWKKQLSALLSPDQFDLPYEQLPEDLRFELWNGNDRFPGVRQLLLQLGEKSDEDDPLADYRLEMPCPDCQGARLNAEARSVTIGGLAIHQFTALPIDEAARVCEEWTFEPDKQPIADPLLRELRSRLAFLKRVGVGYVELDRPVDSLSGGEAQRIRLAGCLGSGLNGVCYVVDEPTIGLHARDTNRLLDVLEELRDQGNSVLVVEHDEAAIDRAEWIIDLGPMAGLQGGEVVNQGERETFIQGPGLTAAYLRGEDQVSVPGSLKPSSERTKEIVLTGVRHHNLDNVTLTLPLQQLVCITGVSGSGKSSLIVDVLVPALKHAMGLGQRPDVKYESIAGFEPIQDVVQVDQGPIGRTPRSCPASYSGMIDHIRNVFAQTKDARVRGYSAGRFSFNSKEGQCPKCQGLGALLLEMTFLPDTYTPCPLCRGKRYNRATLNVHYRGKSIADILEMTVSQAEEFFENHPKIHAICKTLREVGLGYLQLGQWATTLSGGEAQRLKLATKLANPGTQPTLFVLDEPTTGLHFHDIARLLSVLRQLVDNEHSVVVIEHHLELIRQADWVIDLGPEGGSQGGKIIAQTTPTQLISIPESITGRELKRSARA